MSQYQDKFQSLLRELFQFDCADLDFGVYRIMNHKRDVVEKFISEDLPKAVANELDRGDLADQSQAAKDLQDVARQIGKALGKDALDADGKLDEAYHETNLGKEYLTLQAKASGGRGRDALEAQIFNHLYTFFGRYYQDGDFISKRRYSKRQKYAIPYNGEEAHLHWANNDQYYVKTEEHFRDYTFASRGVTVHFELVQADVEQNNVKGEKRFFLPQLKKIDWDEMANRLVIPFEYRPFTEQEAISYGKKKQQETIIAEALEKIPKQIKKAEKALLALKAEKSKDLDDEPVTFLEYHLRQYTRRNTSDFFIHKNLKGFLSRELDFYLKNEVLNLDEMEAAGEGRVEGWFQIMQVIKAIGNRIIEFLAQIEDFQKMLWEKRKFITDTQYCITVGIIPEDFYPDIAGCEDQWTEWKELFHIDEEKGNLFSSGKSKKDKRVSFLKSHPTLVLDTRHFTQNFVDGLLASFDDLDGISDGLLLHGENYQMLNLLLNRYRQQIQYIHIDPPYNTATSGFLYKNDYQHSSWLSMMADRIKLSYALINDSGCFACHIDENEYERIRLFFDRLSLPYLGTIIWDKRNPMMGSQGIAIQHEYILWASQQVRQFPSKNENASTMLRVAAKIVDEHGGVNDNSKAAYVEWIKTNKKLSGGERLYCNLEQDGRIYRLVAMTWPNPTKPPEQFFVPLIHPITKKPCPVPSRGWSRSPEKMKELLDRDEIVFGKDESTQPQRKVYLTPKSTKPLSSVIYNGRKGKSEIEALGLGFTYCHPVSLYEELTSGALMDVKSGIILDYFAGSGTTAHAAIKLNREDGGKRKFILVEMEEYFDQILVPRIKKIIFTPEWKDGKPKRMANKNEAKRSPRIVKYIRLESYEDALNNIDFDDVSGQAALKFDDYLLRYMLHWETQKSDTMLNVEKLVSPFTYKLHIHQDGQTREKTVDIPETFNYLLGLHVTKRLVAHDDDRRYMVYRGRIDHREIAIIWRETEGWTKKDLERDKKFVAAQKLTEGADEIFVNGDSFIPGAKALEPVFKRRMFSPVEA